MAFTISEQGFELDGEPTQVISGALHYFRIHPDLWAKRLDQAVELGLNTIETYVAWNFHSSAPGEFRLDGWRDLGRFLDLAAERGLMAIVRPGPYICAEWDNAGFPAWLTAQNIPLRTSDERFMAEVERYFAQVLPVVAKRQVTRGGNVIMVQVENEYGAYGADKEYLRATAKLIRAQGIDVPLCTCDQAERGMLERGSLPELLTTATFGSRSLERLETLRHFQPTGPLMCMEYWNGWFDSWAQQHHVTEAEASANDLEQLLRAGASLNLYMLHGGTNFDLRNGANHKGTYTPITTSYDYDAPVSEDGRLTNKFVLFQEAIARATGQNRAPATPYSANAPAFRVPLFRSGDWHTFVGDPQEFDALPSFDQVDPAARFVLYTTHVQADDEVLIFEDVRDRAYCFLDGQSIGALHRTARQHAIALPHRGGELTVLVEDLGRVNYGHHLGEPKGLIGTCRSASRAVTDWSAARIHLEDMAHSTREGAQLAAPASGPILLSTTFDAPEDENLFLDTRGLANGIVWFNGLLIGRYWSAGPAHTLYIPAPIVKAAGNVIQIWEFEAVAEPELSFVNQPLLGHTEA